MRPVSESVRNVVAEMTMGELWAIGILVGLFGVGGYFLVQAGKVNRARYQAEISWRDEHCVYTGTRIETGWGGGSISAYLCDDITTQEWWGRPK